MSAIGNLYDFSTPFEDALAFVFATVGGLTAVNSRGGARFQDERPRVEIKFEKGNAKQSYQILADGSRRNASWVGQLTLQIITGSDTAANDSGILMHREAQAMVEFLIEPMRETLNTGTYSADWNGHVAGDPYLKCHKIQNIVGQSFVPITAFDKGNLSSKPTYQVDFGIDKAAWGEVYDSDVIVSTAGRDAFWPTFAKLYDSVRQKNIIATVEDGQIVLRDE